jgi:hypothetical protein
MIRNVGEYFLKQLPWHRGKLSRVGQFPSDTTILFHPNVETYCNIDGEFFQLSKPKSITFRRTCTVSSGWMSGAFGPVSDALDAVFRLRWSVLRI